MSGLSGFGLSSGHFKVFRNSRTVLTTEGTLVNLLPTLQSFSGLTVDYPDPPKDYIYAWRGYQNYGFNPAPSTPDSYAQSNTAQVFFTRTPQEWESAQTLMSAPDGADIFFGLLRITRTLDPTHTWYWQTLNTLQPSGVWIPWQGSGMMEVALGLSRALHLSIEGGSLKLVAQQSVGPAIGGAVHEWGDYPSIFVIGQDNEGGNFQTGTTAGFVTWTSSSSPYRKSSSRVVNTDFSPGSFNTHRISGSDPCDTTDPTSYRSTYSVDVKGYFGRRS